MTLRPRQYDPAAQRAHWYLVAAALAALTAISARAQVIDRIDVHPAGREAEIRVRFDTQVQYQRHSPRTQGELLRINVRVNGSDPGQEGPRQTTTQVARSEYAEPFSVTWPEAGGLLVKFDRPTSFRVRQGNDGRSVSIFVPMARRAPEPEPIVETGRVGREMRRPAEGVAQQGGADPQAATPAPAVPDQAVEASANSLIDEARRAIAERRFGDAIDRLNLLLNLPPNAQSESAQALIGHARELNGEFAKARAEYEIYLKLYPQGGAVATVRERLAGIGSAGTGGGSARRDAGGDGKPAQWTLSGSFSQYWYVGQSQIEILTPQPGLTFNRETLTNIDQRALVSTIDLTARRRDDQTDTRAVLRDTHTLNTLPGSVDRNRLNAAYVEQTHRNLGYFVRFGRQPGNAGGVLSRFDGLWAGYNLNPRWRVNGVVGSPVEFTSPFRRQFYGMSVDLMPQKDQWGASLYFLQQNTSGVTDRRALGMETRFFDARRTFYMMLDYDLAFRATNIAMAQGNWQSEGRSNVFFLVDHRRSPPYSITNGLIGQSLQSVASYVQWVGEAALREQARQLTARSNLAMVGATHPITERWQLGADVRVSNISGTAAVGDMPAGQGTGNIIVYSGQAIGNAIFRENDLGVLNLSLIQSPTYSAQSVSLNYVYLVSEALRMDGSLRWYGQRDNSGIHLSRWAPTIKAVYKLRERLYLDAEGMVERTVSQGPMSTETSKRYFFYTGYRWDIY